MEKEGWLGQKIETADRREALFGGQGTVAVWNLMKGAAPPFSAILACELEPRGLVGPHVQQRDPEIVIGVEGEGIATVGKDTISLTPGVVVHVPHGRRLSLQNVSETEPLRYLIIKARVGG